MFHYSQDISEMQILLVCQISECKSISVFLVQVESISSLILTPHDKVQSNRSGNRDAVKDDQSSPKLRIVLATRLTFDELWTDDVTYAIGNKDSSRHEALLSRACHI